MLRVRAALRVDPRERDRVVRRVVRERRSVRGADVRERRELHAALREPELAAHGRDLGAALRRVRRGRERAGEAGGVVGRDDAVAVAHRGEHHAVDLEIDRVRRVARERATTIGADGNAIWSRSAAPCTNCGSESVVELGAPPPALDVDVDASPPAPAPLPLACAGASSPHAEAPAPTYERTAAAPSHDAMRIVRW